MLVMAIEPQAADTLDVPRRKARRPGSRCWARITSASP